MRSSLLFVFLISSFASVAANAAEPAPTYPAEAFFNTTEYRIARSELAFSHDNARLLITSDASGVQNVYALDLKSSDQSALTSSKTNTAYAISYFPNDNRFLYVTDDGGDELEHIFVDGPDMKPVDLTPGDKVKANFLGWIDGGEAFLLETDERKTGYFDVYRYDASSYQRTMVFRNDMGLIDLAASRDGDFVAGLKYHSYSDIDIYLAGPDGDNEPRLITPHKGVVGHKVFAFTPDNHSLVFGSDAAGEFMQAYSYNLITGETEPLFKEDWDVEFVKYSSSGRYRVHGMNADATTEITVFDTRKEKELRLPKGLPRGNLSNVRFSSDERTLAFVIDADIAPPNIFTLDLSKNTLKLHTQALSPEIDPGALVESEAVRFESFDGLKVPGILYKPKGASAENPVSAMVWIHGGPGGQSRTEYSAMRQHLINHGYAIFAVNNRGSSGYGKTFFKMDDRKHGEVDLQDIVYARAYLEGLDWIDPSRIGVMGNSYGGYLTMAALAFEPDVFDVGIDIFGFTDMTRFLNNVAPWFDAVRDAIYEEMGDPVTDEERHRRVSPLFHAENIRVPVLIVQGANDLYVRANESEDMVKALQSTGVAVEYVFFPDEGHGFRKRQNRIAASEAYLKFLDRYLAGRRD